MSRRLFVLLLLVLSVSIVHLNEAQAGRRGVRVDLGAWFPGIPIVPYVGIATESCPGAAVTGSPYYPPYYQQGVVIWDSIVFQAVVSYGLVLTQFDCQHSRPYSQFANPSEYLNSTIFPADEQSLANMVGSNTNNAVYAIRYSYLQSDPNGPTSRQWTFYFFSGGLTVVALYGVPENASGFPYEMIFDNLPPYSTLWTADLDGFTGQYFCFQGREYIGDCVPPEPPPEPPPEMIFYDNFE